MESFHHHLYTCLHTPTRRMHRVMIMMKLVCQRPLGAGSSREERPWWCLRPLTGWKSLVITLAHTRRCQNSLLFQALVVYFFYALFYRTRTVRTNCTVERERERDKLQYIKKKGRIRYDSSESSKYASRHIRSFVRSNEKKSGRRRGGKDR